jgi:hypothetical protein
MCLCVCVCVIYCVFVCVCVIYYVFVFVCVCDIHYVFVCACVIYCYIQTNDSSLPGPYAVHTWEIPNIIEGARIFRIVMTGRNDMDGQQLACSGFEVYGVIGSELTEGILKPSHWLFKDEDG